MPEGASRGPARAAGLLRPDARQYEHSSRSASAGLPGRAPLVQFRPVIESHSRRPLTETFAVEIEINLSHDAESTDAYLRGLTFSATTTHWVDSQLTASRRLGFTGLHNVGS